MGLVSLGANTLWHRILMFFMQPSKYPLEPYTLHVKPKRMMLFTAIQLGLFALLYTVKAIKTIAIVFPLIIACCIPIRLYLLPKIFTEKELVMLDGDDDEIMTWLADHAEIAESEDAGKEDEGLVKPDIEQPEPMVAEEIVIAPHEGEERDTVPPLPTEVAATAPRKRRTRKKAMSCPSPHLFFSEVPYGAPPEIALAVVQEEPLEVVVESSAASDAMVEEAEPAGPRRRRPGRTKALSCPTHLLKAEADRQIDRNYFFGFRCFSSCSNISTSRR